MNLIGGKLMPTKNRVKSRIIFMTFFILIGLVITPGIMHTVAINGEDNLEVNKIITFFQEFSSPKFEENEQYIEVEIEEADSFLTQPGVPKLPVIVKTYEFPIGTKIKDINCVPSDVNKMSVSKKIEPVLSPKMLNNGKIEMTNEANPTIYKSHISYPTKWFKSDKGSGINKNGEQVLFLSIHIYPVRYNPMGNTIDYIDNIKIAITYKESKQVDLGFEEHYDYVIITPNMYSPIIKELVDHKNNHGIKTVNMTLDDIYELYPGRDKAEQIKYFIKDAKEKWNVSYVLLVGDIKQLPIRAVESYPWSGFGDNVLSDLYYADIYDENLSFCSWDSNNNDIFGEVEYYLDSFPPVLINIDNVDLYPDVHIGRLACANVDEAEIAVDKIITYEENTFDQTWFKRIILAGGDTFPPSKGSPPFIFEGEITNEKVAQQLPDFKHIKLWTSKRNLNAFTFNRAINKGAGFLSYAGHGFEHGWGTYRPNCLRSTMGFTEPLYYTPFIKALRNQYKLPIIFFDACLTAKLDFNVSDLENYYPKLMRLLSILTRTEYDPSDYFSCFAWSFIKKENGGAIATIGATRPAYTWVDKDGVYAGAGYLDVHFFKAYQEGITVGQMFTQAQKDYINYVGDDYFTIEEYLLLGDPTLMVCGYP